MSRCIHSCRCKWLINITEVIQFKWYRSYGHQLWRFDKDLSQRPFFIDDYIVFFVDVAVAKFDVVSPADVVVFVFRLVVVPLVLFVVGAVAVILVLLGIF